MLSANNQECNYVQEFSLKIWQCCGQLLYVREQLAISNKIVKASQKARMTNTKLSLLVKAKIGNTV